MWDNKLTRQNFKNFKLYFHTGRLHLENSSFLLHLIGNGFQWNVYSF